MERQCGMRMCYRGLGSRVREASKEALQVFQFFFWSSVLGIEEEYADNKK